MDKQQDDLPSTSASIKQPQPLQFALSSIIQGHNDDAKCVVETMDRTLISGGRDGFLKFWEIRNGTWENSTSVQQKDSLAINSIAFGALRSSDWESLIFLGRKNGSIAMFSPANPKDPIKVLQGHKTNVCALYYDEDTGFLMSGSWDHKAVVWPVEALLREDGSNVAIGFLDGHACSVWAVATVPSKLTKFLTGSADKTIKLWSHKYDEIGVYHGHTDVVRALLVLSEHHFLSTSNDASIILWDLKSGDRLRNFLPQHDNFIYTLARLDYDSETNLIISAGEGGCLDIWKLKTNGTLEHKQALKMPVESIWSVAPMQNKDFATATSSGMILIFTADPDKRAPDDIQEFFFSSQYEELAEKEKQTQSAKDPSFDITRFSETTGTAGEGENGFFKRVVGDEFGNPTYQDPFTGTGRYVPGASAPVMPISTDKKKPRNHLVPLGEFYKFGLDGLSGKVFTRLRDLNLMQPPPLKMTDDEVCSTEQILSEADFQINECQVVAIEKGLQWPMEALVPALDIFRISLLHPKFNEIFCSLQPVMGNPPKGQATIRHLLNLLNAADSPEPVRILVCRALSNAASHEFGQQMLLTEISTFCSAVSKQFRSPKAALQIASASALANFARILLLKTESKEAGISELGPREDALRSIISTIRGNDNNFGTYSPVAILRLLQTIIMLMWGQSTLIYLAMELDLPNILSRIKDAVADEDVKSLIRDSNGMIQAI